MRESSGVRFSRQIIPGGYPIIAPIGWPPAIIIKDSLLALHYLNDAFLSAYIKDFETHQ
jgi:hypothetical protein